MAKNSKEKDQKKKLFMDGAKVLMFTMDMVPKCVEGLLKKANKSVEDIDLFVFHQASKIVMDNIIRRLQLPEEKVFMGIFAATIFPNSFSLSLSKAESINRVCFPK